VIRPDHQFHAAVIRIALFTAASNGSQGRFPDRKQTGPFD
jgi:hypothetical protein